MAGKHKLRIDLSEAPVGDAVVSGKKITLRERLLRKVLGPVRSVTVLVPGNQVGSVEIVEPADGFIPAKAVAGGER